ncbi:trp operon leader peptide [Cronobacter turicensis]|nr:trp operon leader peptide [Cronobacter turicensis]EKM0370668.1 trp operon leader peptide [Cronobacter turicensis]EKM0374441.1 trp operon leader peptide [Cronobacter turicensis]EKM5063967.1 trp operon leader peptide [Cronobacter turicensis]EKM5760370.1 trp operon leader peptide [Cronobacter turicensis]
MTHVFSLHGWWRTS